MNKVFVGGLHYDTRDGTPNNIHHATWDLITIQTAEFRAYFERFGRVISAEVMFNRETHKSRGFGFIVFENEKGAERVCAEAEIVIDGKVVSFGQILFAFLLKSEGGSETRSAQVEAPAFNFRQLGSRFIE